MLVLPLLFRSKIWKLMLQLPTLNWGWILTPSKPTGLAMTGRTAGRAMTARRAMTVMTARKGGKAKRAMAGMTATTARRS